MLLTTWRTKVKIREMLVGPSSAAMAGNYATKKWLPLIVLASSVSGETICASPE